ncbi:MAG: class I SAM-dependent methyltransferase [Burkholderiaceae bacterium]
MSTLMERLGHQIQAAGGWIGVDAFMQTALYSPGQGYYTGGGRPFEADFVTAPMLGPWMGQALWNCTRGLRTAAVFRIREFGGGRGDLAASLMACAQREQAQSPSAAAMSPILEMQMLEVSADLAHQQERTTAGLGSIYWLRQLEPDFSGLVLANEVLDAMPVKLFEWAGDGAVLEWGIEVVNQRLAWRARPASEDLATVVTTRARAARERGLPWSSGYRGEWCPWTGPWLNSLAQSIRSGSVLLVDYGFAESELDHPGRTHGTLCAHYRHQRFDRPEDLIVRVGEQDLTAHVNFSQIAREARQSGFEVQGFVTQGRFLINAGLLEFAQTVIDATPDPIAKAKQLQSLQTMMLESEMGEVFKVMLLTKDLPASQIEALMDCGFQRSDRSASLAN